MKFPEILFVWDSKGGYFLFCSFFSCWLVVAFSNFFKVMWQESCLLYIEKKRNKPRRALYKIGDSFIWDSLLHVVHCLHGASICLNFSSTHETVLWRSIIQRMSKGSAGIRISSSSSHMHPSQVHDQECSKEHITNI